MASLLTRTRPLAPLRRLEGHARHRQQLHEYIEMGGYAVAAWDRTPSDLIDVIAGSGLRGRGGAGFPTGTKWSSVAAEGGRAVVLINAAESEPASFKDRTLIERFPHRVIEGALLAARAVGADECVLYTHDEETKGTIDAARWELEDAGARLPSWRSVVAPRTYVAGEASAAVSFINGHAAYPQSKPPRTHQRGVGGRPTLVQNAETLAHVPGIARHGADWFRQVGSADHPGTTFITLSGGIRRPGVYEVPTGVRLQDVLGDLGCGTPEGIQAVLPGGYFAGWLSPAAVWAGVTLDRASLRAAGSDLGSGAITVVPVTVCGLWQAARLLRFFADESARQCGPCAFGSAAMADVLDRITHGRAHPDDPERLQHYAERVLPGRGGCGHLDGATAAARTALNVFSAEIARHLRYGGCGRPLRSVLPGLEESHDHV